MPRFNVTYEIVTPESAEHGDAEERGFISEGGRLRDAIGDLMETRACWVEGIAGAECDESPIVAPRWITVYNGMEFETGAYENRSLHIPENASNSSRRRIVRLVASRVGFSIR